MVGAPPKQEQNTFPCSPASLNLEEEQEWQMGQGRDPAFFPLHSVFPKLQQLPKYLDCNVKTDTSSLWETCSIFTGQAGVLNTGT